MLRLSEGTAAGDGDGVSTTRLQQDAAGDPWWHLLTNLSLHILQSQLFGGDVRREALRAASLRTKEEGVDGRRSCCFQERGVLGEDGTQDRAVSMLRGGDRHVDGRRQGG